jgi:hypothetical protein
VRTGRGYVVRVGGKHVTVVIVAQMQPAIWRGINQATGAAVIVALRDLIGPARVVPERDRACAAAGDLD